MDASAYGEWAEPVQRFWDRLAHIEANYHFCRREIEDSKRINESLELLKRAAAPYTRRRKKTAVPLHPVVALAVSERAAKATPEGEWPSPDAISDAALEVIENAKAVKGRPADHILEYHVHATMALVRDTCGDEPRATRHKRLDYDPHMTSPGGKMVEKFFRKIDPSIRVGRLVSIIEKARSTKAIEGKHFFDFFPFHGAPIDEKTGLPMPANGWRITSFQPICPITLQVVRNRSRSKKDGQESGGKKKGASEEN